MKKIQEMNCPVSGLHIWFDPEQIATKGFQRSVVVLGVLNHISKLYQNLTM